MAQGPQSYKAVRFCDRVLGVVMTDGLRLLDLVILLQVHL